MPCVSRTVGGFVAPVAAGCDGDGGGGLSCWARLCHGVPGRGCAGRRQPGRFADGARSQCLLVRRLSKGKSGCVQKMLQFNKRTNELTGRMQFE